jgi:hypothetical protein
MIVIARLVRATHEHRIGQASPRCRPGAPFDAEIMGGPDEPGHDEYF